MVNSKYLSTVSSGIRSTLPMWRYFVGPLPLTVFFKAITHPNLSFFFFNWGKLLCLGMVLGNTVPLGAGRGWRWVNSYTLKLTGSKTLTRIISPRAQWPNIRVTLTRIPCQMTLQTDAESKLKSHSLSTSFRINLTQKLVRPPYGQESRSNLSGSF